MMMILTMNLKDAMGFKWRRSTAAEETRPTMRPDRCPQCGGLKMRYIALGTRWCGMNRSIAGIDEVSRLRNVSGGRASSRRLISPLFDSVIRSRRSGELAEIAGSTKSEDFHNENDSRQTRTEGRANAAGCWRLTSTGAD